MRFGLILCLVVGLTGACAPRGAIVLDPAAQGVGDERSIFVATNRINESQRSEAVHFGRADVSVPPDRKSGTITYPEKDKRPNPRTDFVLTRDLRYANSTAFKQGIAEALAKQAPNNRDVVLFVHGYNNTYAEGLYRFAQIAHDTELPGVAVHYSWPSLGQPLAYAADRDSVLFSRDGLEETISLLTQSGARQVVIIGHSMGSSLVMESLRQMAIGGRKDVLSRIDGVVLMSPDIDVDVFRMQAKAVGDLPQPFLIFTSTRDKALNLSARLSAAPARLGSLSDPARVADLQVTLVDVGAFSTGSGHFNAAESPALLNILSNVGDLGQAFEGDVGGKLDLFSGAALTVQNAAQVVLVPDGTLFHRRK